MAPRAAARPISTIKSGFSFPLQSQKTNDISAGLLPGEAALKRKTVSSMLFLSTRTCERQRPGLAAASQEIAAISFFLHRRSINGGASFLKSQLLVPDLPVTGIANWIYGWLHEHCQLYGTVVACGCCGRRQYLCSIPVVPGTTQRA